MIRNFSDHAANERTFLAWVRTAIAIMAFGFLVAKFNVFLSLAQASLGGHPQVPLHSGGWGGVAGVAVTAAGLLIVVLAVIRFLRLRRAIESAEEVPGGARLDLALAGLLLFLGFALVAFLSHTVAAGL
jgi:putative membrane protein